jgi:dolichol-phosphate mannosyltransferase
MISVVAPVFNESASLPMLYERLIPVLRGLEMEYEIIFVDDGSRDRSTEVVKELLARDPRVRLLSFSRNFGHQAAITAGLDHSRGDAVVVMDSDLQHPPELIPKLVEKWRQGCDLVYTVREDTEDATAFKKFTSRTFYRVLNWFSYTPIPANSADFRLLDRRVVTAFGNIRERTRFMRGLTGWVGFKSIGVPYTAESRKAGVSSYNLKKMMRLGIDGIVSFSTVPLYLAIYFGFIEAGLGFLYGLWVLGVKLFNALGWTSVRLEPGWTSVILLITIAGGIQFILIGVLGVYLGKVYEEVKQRPLYLLREMVGFEEDETRARAVVVTEHERIRR